MFRGIRQDQHGASAVEFAIVLPILVLFLFGIIQFGLAFARTQGMEAAAREGARLASIGRTVTYDMVETAVLDTRVPFIRPEHIVVEVDGTAGSGATWCNDAEDPVAVTVYVVEGERDRYAITIPMWPGESTPSYESEGTFSCEARQIAP